MIILDTDVLVDALRDFPPAAKWLAALGDRELAIPGYVAMEIAQGCRNRWEQEDVARRLERFDVIWPSPASCDKALSLFNEYHLSSGLGPFDVLIAVTSIDCGQPLYTFNQKHYSALPDLVTVQPYDR